MAHDLFARRRRLRTHRDGRAQGGHRQAGDDEKVRQSTEDDGALELATMLAQSADAQRCFTQKWYEYALGRISESGDECVVDDLTRHLAGGSGSVLDLIVGITESNTFLYGALPQHLENP